MKKICITLSLIIIIIVTSVACVKNANDKNEYLRIHIRANSNNEADLKIKYSVKDLAVNYLTPIVKQSSSKEQLIELINQNELGLESEIDTFLSKNGFNYTCNVKIANELFPTRVYEDLTLNEGYYDAIIIELGKAKGDNWWCVVYPPLCFSGEEKQVEYKSKLKELFNKFDSRF